MIDNPLKQANGNTPRTPEEVELMIQEAAEHYGKFLRSLGFDYEADRQTKQTPHRVAKAWMQDMIVGSVTLGPKMTTFPNDGGYKGVVMQTGIRVNSLCTTKVGS